MLLHNLITLTDRGRFKSSVWLRLKWHSYICYIEFNGLYLTGECVKLSEKAWHGLDMRLYFFTLLAPIILGEGFIIFADI